MSHFIMGGKTILNKKEMLGQDWKTQFTRADHVLAMNPMETKNKRNEVGRAGGSSLRG